MKKPTIIHRGRGPEIAGTRITVYDIMDYTRENWHHAAIAATLRISSEEVLVALEYIEAHKDEPFYLFVSFTAPHGPLQPRQGAADAKRISHIKDKNRKRYAGLVAALDDNVGKILAALKLIFNSISF